jgi:hypothetical protein
MNAEQKWMMNRLGMIRMHVSEVRSELNQAKHRVERAEEVLVRLEREQAQMMVVILAACGELRPDAGHLDLIATARSKARDGHYDEFVEVLNVVTGSFLPEEGKGGA